MEYQITEKSFYRVTVPILWSNTFKLRKSFNININERSQKQIISNYITEFSNDYVISWKIQGVELQTQQKNLFDYSKFLRHLDAYYLVVFIRSWFNFTTKDDIYKPESIRAMSTILLSHLLQQTQCLVSLKIASSSTTEVVIAALQENPQGIARTPKNTYGGHK